VQTDLPATGKSIIRVSSSLCKNISLRGLVETALLIRSSRTRSEGRFAIVTDVGWGMRWMRRRQARFSCRAGRERSPHTAKSCGPDIPTLMSSLRHGDVGPDGPDTPRRRWWQKSPVTRESSKETVKTIARGMPADGGVPVVTTLVCFFISHARLWVRTTRPAFPAPSVFWAMVAVKTRTLRAAGQVCHART
jgi:hypothetical protein